MDNILRGLVGLQVQVYSTQGGTEIRDNGMLEAYDNYWVLLDRNGEKLYFSISRIRLIKPL